MPEIITDLFKVTMMEVTVYFLWRCQFYTVYLTFSDSYFHVSRIRADQIFSTLSHVQANMMDHETHTQSEYIMQYT